LGVSVPVTSSRPGFRGTSLGSKKEASRGGGGSATHRGRPNGRGSHRHTKKTKNPRGERRAKGTAKKNAIIEREGPLTRQPSGMPMEGGEKISYARSRWENGKITVRKKKRKRILTLSFFALAGSGRNKKNFLEPPPFKRGRNEKVSRVRERCSRE